MALGILLEGTLRYYPVPLNRLNQIKDIEVISSRYMRVNLHIGYCFLESGCHKYLIERYALFKSFDDISECNCVKCIMGRVPST